MQVFEGPKMLKNKIIDFQVYGYDSPAYDLLFFIWTSLRHSVIKEHFDDLVEYYHENFMAILSQLGCDVSPFVLDKFEDELKMSSKIEIFHTFMMLRAIFAKKGEFAFDMSKGPIAIKKEDISEAVLDRCELLVQICVRRGWI